MAKPIISIVGTDKNSKLKEIMGDCCGSCSYFNKVGKEWSCTVNPPEFCYVDEEQDPIAVIYIRGCYPQLSSAPACFRFKPRTH